MKRVRWGILSTAKIGVAKVIPAMQSGEYCDIVAIASRDIEKARSAARQLGIRKAYASYEELLRDPEIDAVYIPLPNHLHVPWSVKALNAGKHVLCEKPIALTSAQAEELLMAARNHPRLKVMEAFMYRFHPQWKAARQLVQQGKIGDLRTIQSFFSYHNIDPRNIRNQFEMGGGALMDIGCYCISLARFIFDDEPQRVFGIMEYDEEMKIDRLTSGMLKFSRGTSTFTCATQLAYHQHVIIFGTKGKIELEIPFNPPTDKPCTLKHQYEDKTDEIRFDICNQYTIQGDLFNRAILRDEDVPTKPDDAVANMKVIDAVISSAKMGTWMDL